MAINRLRKFRRIDDVLNFLNGGIVGGPVNKVTGGSSSPIAGVSGLVGKTLIFSSPSAATVTFAVSSGAGGSANPPGTNPDPYTLLFKDIKAQIEAVLATVHCTTNAEGQLVITEVTPSAGVAVTGAGTANTLLGFDSAQATSGKLYSPVEVSNTAPCWVWAESGNDNMTSIFTWE